MENVKIALIGNLGVGKLTLINLILGLKNIEGLPNKSQKMLMKRGEISDKYSALIVSGATEAINSEELKLDFFSNSDIVIFVTYKFKDMLETSKIKEKIMNYLPNAQYAVIANKQDLADSVDATQVINFFNLPVIGIVATSPDHREALVNFLIEFINP
ncbi:MAG: hypothetical protein EAX96_07270 [Candidatus Lokiarchaeota archaeon]|nr:hypothetical protein [Candidatus Lokiarchaeota archaeon]